MKIAVNSLKNLEKLKGHEVIYVFEDDPLEKLFKTNLHCMRVMDIDKVDINLTDYNIRARKRAKIDDGDLFEFPPIKQNKYAIIVPNYNNDQGVYKGKSFLRNCIESVLNQTYQNFELIVVDDVSTDNSAATIKEYERENIGKVHLIQNVRKRYNGGSRNVGIEYALKYVKPDYICFLDSDDWWKHDRVLENINEEIDDSDMMIIGAEMLYKDGVKYRTYNEWSNYEDFYISDGTKTIWCTAWARVIRADKIVYFCEDTLMEDRVWSYKQADNVDFEKVKNLHEICYVWNRTNTNSVTQVRNPIWNASAWCHIGHQLQFLSEIKHKEMIPLIEKRMEVCKKELNRNVFTQY